MHARPAVVVASAALLVAVTVLATMIVFAPDTAVTHDGASPANNEALTIVESWSEWRSRPGSGAAITADCNGSVDRGDCYRRFSEAYKSIERMVHEIGQDAVGDGQECFRTTGSSVSAVVQVQGCLAALWSGGQHSQSPEAQTTTSASPAIPRSARPYLSRIQGDLGTPMESILSQMPDGMIPTRDLRGEDRIFTYTFGDGSQMILVFRPSGNQSGLELYMVDVRD